MRSFKTEGFVIKRKNFGEADRIITLFTKNHGKMRVKAPGVRRITSRRSSHIELLNLSTLNLYESSSSHMPVMTEASIMYDFDKIKKNLGKIGQAFYICELVDKLCAEHQENRKVFYLIQETLDKLEELDSDSILNEFEEKILSFSGFIPQRFVFEDRQRFIEKIVESKIRSKDVISLLAG